MRFDSFVFAVFLLAFLAMYWLTRSRTRQNGLILLGSYVFYGWWDWRFLLLMALSTGLDYGISRRLGAEGVSEGGRRRLMWTSVSANLLILGTFKYFNFFAESFADLLASLGMAADVPTLAVVLPVGISFYTFQTMGYTIDVYRRVIPPCDSLLNFACYVAFFPQLVAGPIERASRLLPQFEKDRTLDVAGWRSGLTLIVYGLVKKIAVADNMAPFADWVYDGSTSPTGPLVFAGTLAFAVQIYADFSGYSDVARGVARLLGFELCVNFDKPYVSASPSEFWQRWHISLSQWLRDYLYIPLGGNRGGPLATYRNLLLTMLLGGLWHGAAWNFVLWGLYHGLLLCLYRALGLEERIARAGWLGRVVAVLVFAAFTLYGWLLFRAGSWDRVAVLSTALLSGWYDWTHAGTLLLVVAYYSAPIVVHHVLARERGEKWQPANGLLWRATIAAVVLLGIVHARADDSAFIYFQF